VDYAACQTGQEEEKKRVITVLVERLKQISLTARDGVWINTREKGDKSQWSLSTLRKQGNSADSGRQQNHSGRDGQLIG